jgi:RNA polymerase-interacting CarD/CdnL/TRCF family regulator
MAATQLNQIEAPLAFRAGQLVVHPVYGLCRIARIEQAHGRNGLEACYVFNMGSTSNPVKVLMPAAQAEAVGLRRPITRQNAERIFQVFHAPSSPLAPRSKEQLDEVSARLNSCDLLQVAETIRDLAAAGVTGWSGQMDSAFGNHRRSEQAMLSQALSRLVDELVHVQHVSRKEVEAEIHRWLSRTRRKSHRLNVALAT